MDIPIPWTSSALRALRKAVLGFYRRTARPLPWRETRDWYPVLVSELMLQQTRAEAVVPYFTRWMARFPTPVALAAADSEDVLSVWQGLGYYARARRLHAAVREVVEERGGNAPENPVDLMGLPGVGQYTAGAVASIAFGWPAPAVDGNVRRVLARLTDSPDPSSATLRAWALALVEPADPGAFNQGLMDIGARVCTPRNPNCAACPVRRFCLAASRGTTASRPAPKSRRPAPEAVEVVLVLVRGGRGRERVLFRRRSEEGLLGGMWELPGAALGAGESPGTVAQRLAANWARDAGLVSPLERLDHAFTHRRMAYLPFLFRSKRAFRPGGGSSFESEGASFRWARLGSEVTALPLPAAQRRMLEIALGSQ
jgi:A/G-specific adenine glycosylase